MYDFEKLKKEGADALKEWHKKSYSSEELARIIPCEENNYQLNFSEIKELFQPLIIAMENSPQDQFHHSEGDVWTHTKMVMSEMIEQENYQKADLFNKKILFWSAFLHDIAKPLTVELNEDTGGIGNPAHSVKGAQDVRLFMWRNGFDNELRENVARVIRYHQRPFHWPKTMSEFSLRSMSHELSLKNLITMARADTLGRRVFKDDASFKKKALENLELMEYMALENDCLEKPWDYPFSGVVAKKIYFSSNGRSHETRDVIEDPCSDVIFLCGLPASGKNYWVKKFGENREVLSYDDERERLNLKNGRDGQAVQAVKEKMKELLRKKEPFIINATHINEELRGKNLALLNAYGAKIRIIHLEATMKELIKRNNERNDAIPDKSINNMAKRWSPPSPHEGHEVLWWDKNKGVPVYKPFLTTEKDLKNPWKFSDF